MVKTNGIELKDLSVIDFELSLFSCKIQDFKYREITMLQFDTFKNIKLHDTTILHWLIALHRVKFSQLNLSLIEYIMKPLVKILLLSTIPIFGCNAASSPHTENGSIEAIYGIIVSADNLKVQVQSKGCTNQNSFDLLWQGNNLTITRIQADNCRRIPYKKWLTFHLPIHKKQFVLLNLLSTTTLKSMFSKKIVSANKGK
jgi:hypothetical protein